MKKLYTILLAVASLAFILVSCQKVTPHQPGEADAAGCYGVYFPSQDESLTLDPSDPTTATITVARANTSGAITVPYTLTGNTDIISASDIAFADGQSETTCTLTFNSAEVGVTYTVHFLISDEKYASKYNNQPIAFDYTIMRDKWNSLGKAKFTDSWIFDATTVYECELIQNDKDKSLFRLIAPYNTENLTAFGYIPDYYKDAPSPYIQFKLLNPGDVLYSSSANPIKITQEGLVYFSNFYSGYYRPDYKGAVNSYYPATFTEYHNEASLSYNKVLQYQSNGLPAGVQLAPYFYIEGLGGWDMTQTDGIITIVFPGAVLTDYSIALEAGQSSEGVLPVSFALGTDVAQAKYAIYEGSLNVAQLEAKVANISDGTEKNTKSVAATGTENVTLDKTGVYTLVAVTFSADGKAQESDNVGFSYVAKGDSVPVVVNCGLTVTDRYTPSGYTSENSLEYYAYGTGVTDAKIGLYKHIDVVKDFNAVVKELSGSKSISKANLDSLNASGLVGLVTKLSPGTAYDLVVIATNGYETKTITASATTNGTPLPIYLTYTDDDYKEAFAPAHSSGYFGTWNLYAIDEFGSLGMREYIGKAVLSQSETATTGPDSDGYYDEYVYATGFAGSAAADNKFDDKIELDYYGGALYFSSKTTVDTKTNVKYVSPDGKSVYNASYIYYGIPVADGYVAFMVTPKYSSMISSITFCTSSAYYTLYSQYLLVNPAKDDNGVAPSSVGFNAVSGQRKSLNALTYALEGYKHSIKAQTATSKSQGTVSGIKVEVDPKSVNFSSSASASVKTNPVSLHGRPVMNVSISK
jgi:hypothetical protein